MKTRYVRAPMGRERDILAGMPTTGFCERKKDNKNRQQKPQKNPKKVQTRDKPLRYLHLKVKRQKPQGKKRDKHTKPVAITRAKNTGNTTPKLTTCYYRSKKLKNKEKAQNKSKTPRNYIYNA